LSKSTLLLSTVMLNASFVYNRIYFCSGRVAPVLPSDEVDRLAS